MQWLYKPVQGRAGDWLLQESVQHPGVDLQMLCSSTTTSVCPSRWSKLQEGTGLAMGVLQPVLETLLKSKLLGYNNKRLRININVPLKSEAKVEHEDTQRKELIVEVISQLCSKFKPSVAVIKECVHILIDKEYLERAQGVPDQCIYLP
ncbi:hypothetical protein HPB48_022343 [Haemaphysalis longicornis]|uniref:Cullin neddylation domain-containing protein n=1 Tax=Haemaphysalis longicornis TaxID=44386 RepID=A0A9J6FUS1_HAELO|nr:hypothetical protein HPB48_022343 [Haemaphysalis longicornis]